MEKKRECLQVMYEIIDYYLIFEWWTQRVDNSYSILCQMPLKTSLIIITICHIFLRKLYFYLKKRSKLYEVHVINNYIK